MRKRNKIHGELSCSLGFNYAIPEGKFVFHIVSGKFHLQAFYFSDGHVSEKTGLSAVLEQDLSKHLKTEWREFCLSNDPHMIYDQGITTLVKSRAFVMGRS